MRNEMDMLDCPQCGEPTEELHEGYCEQCCKDRQDTLNAFNAEYDHWQSLTDAERAAAIKWAMR